MKISIKTKKGERFEIDTNSNDYVNNIKCKISTIKSIPTNQQHLIYNCTTLKDDEKLYTYSIQSGSEILLIQKQNALLLQASKIFVDSSLIDHIHQSYIDIQSHPPLQDVTNLLIESISYLDEKLDFDTTKELFLLILSCFSQYPDESFKIFEIKYQTHKISSLHIILLTSILSQIPNHSYDDLLSTYINELIPQIRNNQSILKIQGYEIAPEFQPTFITNLILSTKLTEQIVTSFYQYFFSKSDFSTLNLFIQKVHKAKLLTKIPESQFLENNIFLQLTYDNLSNFISVISEENFKNILPILYTFLKQKEITPTLSRVIVNKGIEYNLPPGTIDFLFTHYDDFKSVSFWEYLYKNESFISDYMVRLIEEKERKGIDHFAKTPFVLRSVEHPERLSPEIISYSLLNANDLPIYSFAFQYYRIECDVLGTIEFWEHILSIYKKIDFMTTESDLMNKFAFYFQKYIKENEMFTIFDQLIFNHFPPNKSQSEFLCALFKKLPETYVIEFNSHSKELVDKLLSRKEVSSPFCLSLFDLSSLANEKPEKVTPQLLYNLALSKIKNNNINKIEIMKITHEPNENLIKFIEQGNNYDLIANIDDESLSLIACSLFYSIKTLNLVNLFTPTKSSDSTFVEGLTTDNFLPFLAIMMNYKEKIFIDSSWNHFFTKSISILNDHSSPLQIASLNSIIRKIEVLLQSTDFQPNKVFNFVEMLIDLLLKGEYKADPLILITAIFKLTNKHGFCSRNFFSSNKNQIFNLIVENIPKINNLNMLKYKLNLNEFQNIAARIFTQLIEESTSYEQIIETIKFLNINCKNLPKLFLINGTNIKTAFHKAIYEEKWNDVTTILNFKYSPILKGVHIITDLILYGKKIPKKVLNINFDIKKLGRTDDIIAYLLAVPNLENNLDLFQYVYFKLMMNKSIAIKYITIFLEKVTQQQVLSPEDVLKKLYYMNKYFTKDLIEAIKSSYNYSGEKQKFIKKICCQQITISCTKTFNFDFLTKIVQDNSYQSFICLQNIASYFPFLFEPETDENHSLVAVNIVLPTLNCLSQIFNSKNTQENLDNYKKAFAALSFIYSCLYSVKFLSVFVIWIFENITKLNESQVFGLSHILISLFKTESIYNILFAYAIKYNFLDIIMNLLNREIPEGLFKYYYNQNLYELSMLYFRSFSSIQNKGDALFIEQIQANKILTPFENQFNNSMTICPTIINKLSFSFPRQTKLLTDIFIFIERINKNQYFWIYQNFQDTEKDIQNEIPKFMTSFQNDIPVLVKEKFKNIPSKITPEMHCYLLSCPKWKMNFFENNSFGYYSSMTSLKLLQQIPEYNINLSLTIAKLNEFKSTEEYYSTAINSSEYFSSKINSQKFFSQLIKEATNSNDLNENGFLSYLFKIIGQLNIEFIKYLIQHISDYISKSQINPQTLSVLLQILNKIWTKKKEIENDFLTKCGNKIIDIILSNPFRFNESLVGSVASILCSIKAALPIQVTHIIGLIFCYHPRLTNKAVDLYLKIGDNESFNIMPIIQMRYKKDADEDDPDFSRIKYYIENLPTLTMDCIQTTKILLTKVINQYQQDEYQNDELQEMIIEIYNGVSPSPSLRKSINQQQIMQENIKKSKIDLVYPVPDYIKQTYPIFWEDFYEKNRLFLNKMFKKHERIVSNLIFLLDYTELVSFDLRYSILINNLNQLRGSGNSVFLKVSRSRILLDTFGYWCINEPKDFLSGLSVKFVGENGSDSGGLTREWLTYIVRELMNEENGLFVKNDSQTYHLNPSIDLNFLNVESLKMSGAIIALSILNKTHVNAHLSTALLRQILHQEIQIDDMKDFDESLFNSFKSILDSNDVKPLDLYFSINDSKSGNLEQINLIENGDKIEVTNENKAEYVKLYANYKLKDSISGQIKAFCEGFESIINHDYIKMFTPKELDVMICGENTIDIENMKKFVIYEGNYHIDHPVIVMFYNVISKWSQENLLKLVQFITGTPYVGANGFEFFQKIGIPVRISPGKSKSHLPSAHTCSNHFVLPEYDNEKDMNDKLLSAIQQSFFGFS